VTSLFLQHQLVFNLKLVNLLAVVASAYSSEFVLVAVINSG